VFSSRLWRWVKEDQEEVVNNPGLTFVDDFRKGVIPKVGSELGAEIYRYIQKAPKKLGDIISKDGHIENITYYHTVAMYWIKAYDFIPYFKRDNENSRSISTAIKSFNFSNPNDRNLSLLLINSSIFYYWWIAQGDEFNVLVSQITDFGLHGYEKFFSREFELSNLVSELMEDYQKNSEIKSTSLSGSKCDYQEFYPRQSRHIINRIDNFIAPIYGLTETQNKYLKEYDLIWRTDKE